MNHSITRPALTVAGAFSCMYLRLGETERRGQLHSLWCGQIPLDLKPLLQAGQLRVGENSPGLPASAVLPRQLCVVLEQRRHLHPCR